LYACKGGVCQNACAASADCVGGAICDGTGKCVPPPTPPSDDGGCSFGHGADGSWFALLAAAAILGARSRKRTTQ
jgi:MYXO-CTERM domain-containing protein